MVWPQTLLPLTVASCYPTAPMNVSMNPSLFSILLGCLLVVGCVTSGPQRTPSGFSALFNGTDLTGWRGGDTFDHRKWLAMPEAERAGTNTLWTTDMRKHWRAENGELIN